MHIIIGLGNPGKEYHRTRHNVGFDVLEVLSQKYDIPIRKIRCKAVVGEGTIRGERVVLAQPQTFMNLSGESVAPVVKYHNATVADLVVIQDDIDLPLGRLRIRTGGSCGGHNGVRNIIERLGSQDFTRVKIGVGKDRANVVAHVLGKFDPASRQIADAAVAAAAKAVQAVVGKGAEQAMNLFNSFDASP